MSDLDFTHCGSLLDQDLLKNTMGDISNTSYTLACTGGLGSVLQTAAPFEPCGTGSFTTFCIGARGQQHGCYAGSCNLLDWTGTIAPPCNDGIIKYIRLQTAGLSTPCCAKDGQCSPPVAPFECDNSRSLQMCVADGQSTLCIDSVTKSMCSANYTLVVDRDTTFKACAGGGFFDMDLFSDTMGDVMNRTYTFECVGNSFSIQSPPFTQCPPLSAHPALCIGAEGQQHACQEENCHIIDWTGAIAAPCSDGIVKYAKAQDPGLATPCCAVDGSCVPPADAANYHCGDDARSIRLCVLGGQSTVCVDPSNNEICSRNVTGRDVSPSGAGLNTNTKTMTSVSGTGTGAQSDQVPGITSSPGSSRGHSGLGTTDIIAIITSLIGVPATIITILMGYWAYRDKKQKKREAAFKTTQPVNAVQGDEPFGRRSDRFPSGHIET